MSKKNDKNKNKKDEKKNRRFLRKKQISAKKLAKLVKKDEELKELRLYQDEMAVLQDYLEHERDNHEDPSKNIGKKGYKLVVVLEGRDASGKGGTGRRITENLNPKQVHTIAVGKPTVVERGQDYFQRYVEFFPTAGDIVFFDRSWYNRTMVEPALGFCTEKEYEDYVGRVSNFEKLFFNNNSEKTHKCKTKLIKIYFSIDEEEQVRRFEKRQSKGRKKWKFSEADAQAQEKWSVFTDMKYKMLKKTNTASNPWDIIRSKDKHKARIEAMKLILRAFNYTGKSKTLDFTLDTNVWVSGDVECAEMKAARTHD